jgi:Domain of unknown function (DUF4282)
VGDFFSFDRMITPAIIKVVFWIGLVLSVLGGLAFLLAGSGGAKLLGLFYLILGPLFVRVYCELLIVIFKMNDTLSVIALNTRQEPRSIPFLPGGEGPVA